MAISMMVQPSDQISAGAPYPLGPLSMISGAMYWRVPEGEGEGGVRRAGRQKCEGRKNDTKKGRETERKRERGRKLLQGIICSCQDMEADRKSVV